MSNQCANCKHFQSYHTGSGFGECRRFPPIRTASQNVDGSYNSYWPETEKTDWCGEFSVNLKVEETP